VSTNGVFLFRVARLSLIAHDDLNCASEFGRVRRHHFALFGPYNGGSLLSQQLKEGNLTGGVQKTGVCVIEVYRQVTVLHIPGQLHVLLLDFTDGWVDVKVAGK